MQSACPSAYPRGPFLLLFGLVIAACDASGDSVETGAPPLSDTEVSETQAERSCSSDASLCPFQGCATDDECIVVKRAGCCDNGWREAVNKTRAAAYARSASCMSKDPICLQYLIVDNRVPKCDAKTSTCVLVSPPEPPP